jgi:hypothetical protein
MPGLHNNTVDLGEAEIMGNISEQQINLLKIGSAKHGL